MKAESRNASEKLQGSATFETQGRVSKTELGCPVCGQYATDAAVERYGRYECFACKACDLHFWSPREMPDASWYERLYGRRNTKLMPLEPGHKYFLSDPAAPRGGELLDVGCGTGNFLAAARYAGYQVSGTELDRDAARFTKEKVGVPRIFPMTIMEFAQQNPGKVFDTVTFFEVLEHQAAPAEFLEAVRTCLRPRAYIALSVPNRERWLTGPDVLDYPPNHFLRWSVRALKNFLGAHGFEVIHVREQPAGVSHTAQMINIALSTGLSRPSGGATASFRDIIQMDSGKASAIIEARPTARQRTMQIFARIKHAACFPVAIAVYPYIRSRGCKGAYLYCLARRND